MFNKKGLNVDGFLYLTLNEFEKTKILELIHKDYVPIYQSRYKDNFLLGFVTDKLCLPINGRKLDYYDNLNRFMNNENIFICAFDNFNGKYYSATVPFKQFFLFLDIKENMCMDTVINLTKMNQGITEEYTEDDKTLNTFHEITLTNQNNNPQTQERNKNIKDSQSKKQIGIIDYILAIIIAPLYYWYITVVLLFIGFIGYIFVSIIGIHIYNTSNNPYYIKLREDSKKLYECEKQFYKMKRERITFEQREKYFEELSQLGNRCKKLNKQLQEKSPWWCWWLK